jgi:WD40 repeat protein
MSGGSNELSANPAAQRCSAFLSYNGADKSLVEEIAEKLQKRGLSCWLDTWNLIPGEPWQPAIEQALDQCETCVVFFGPHGLGPWHNEEMRLALRRRVHSAKHKLRVLPVILPAAERARESDLPGFLQGTTWVEFRLSPDDEEALHRLVCGIKGIPPGRRPGTAIPEGECPYLGLKTFQPEDASLFFGRYAKTQELLYRLANGFGTPKEERFLALIGASGSGKSSLALAGLIPALRRGELPESAHWLLVRCRPGARPWESLQIALAHDPQVAAHSAALPALIACEEDEQRRLHLIAQLVLHERPESHRLFVLIDQFEEVFTLCNDESERRLLIDNALYATSVAGGRTIVVLTMRADFYGQCASYPGLRAAFSDHQSLIGPLSEEELRDAIEAPARLAGEELEPGLLELLLADMKGQAGALPFLEHALLKLWERREGRRLTAKAYTDLGRLGGALDAHAEEFFTLALRADEQALCCQILIELVHPGEGAADTKRRVALEDVAPTARARDVLQKLVGARLVTTDRDERPEAAQAELAHEALISGWRRLGVWVNEHREKTRLKERLLDDAGEWQRNARREDFLYRGAQLALAEERFASEGEFLPKLGREFLEASVADRRREQEERQRQVQRRQRILVATLAAFALLAAGASAAALFGLWQKDEAERQRAAAEKEARLAFEAERSANEQAAVARKAENFAQEAQKRTSEVASQANVSLARDSLEAGRDADALAHLAQALRLNQRNYEAAALTGAMLTQNSWPIPVASAMRHEDSVFLSPDGQRVLSTSGMIEASEIYETSSFGGDFGEPQFALGSTISVPLSIGKNMQLRDAASGKPIGEPMQHEGSVLFAQFSADGQRLVTASDNNATYLWDAITGKRLGEPMKHGDRITSAQFSPDGQRVVTTSNDRTARLWNALTGKPIGEPMLHEGAVSSAQFSPDGQRVVTASHDRTARLWDALSGKAIGEPMQHEEAVNSAQFSPDSQRLVTVSNDKKARLWDALTGKQLGEPMQHKEAVNSVQFSPDGQRVVTASNDRTARLWDAVTGKRLGEPMKHEKAVNSARFTPDGRRVETTCSDGTAWLWDALLGNQIGEPMRHREAVNSARFSPDGRRVVTTCSDHTVWLWDALTSKAIGEPMQHKEAVSSAQFSPDGRRLVTSARDHTARLWDALTGRAIGEPMQHGEAVSSAQFSPDGQRLVTTSEDGRACLWDALTGKRLGEPMQHGNEITSAQFSPDSRRVVTSARDHTARLWNALTGELIGWMQHANDVTSVQFSPDGQRLVTTCSDHTARLWNALTGKEIGEPMEHGEAVSSAQFSSDGKRVVTTSEDGRAWLWDALTGKRLGEPIQYGNEITSAQFSPDGRRVVTSARDRTARLWDALTGELIGWMQHENNVTSAQFSPDGQRVVTTCSDRTARLWDVLTGKAIGEPMKHEDLVLSAQFSPDGQRLVTSSRDDTVRLWDVPTISNKDDGEDVLLLAELAEASSGVAIHSSGQAEILNVLTPEQVNATFRKIATKFSAPSLNLTPLQRFMKWSVSDRRSRTTSPFSELTVAEWVEHRINDGALEGLQAATQVDPENARVAAHFGRCLADYALANATDPELGRRARGEADFQTRRALKLAPYNTEVKNLRAKVVTDLGLLDRDQQRIEEARKDFAEALQIRRELAVKNPATYLPDAAATLENLGALDSAYNHPDEARKEYQEALQIYESLVSQDPEQFLPKVARVKKLLDELNRHRPK